MIVRLYTIIALTVFLTLIFKGSTIEAAMFKSATVFLVFVVGTKISIYLLDIIKGNTPKEQESTSQN